MKALTRLRWLLFIAIGVLIGVLGYPLLPTSAEVWIAERHADVVTLAGEVGGEPIVTRDYEGRTLERPAFCPSGSVWEVVEAPDRRATWGCVGADAFGSRTSYLADDATAFKGKSYSAYGYECTTGGRHGAEWFVTCTSIAAPQPTATRDPAGPKPDWCPGYARWGFADVFGAGTAPACTMGTEVIFLGDWQGVAPGCAVSIGVGTTTRTRCPL
jgi:hypothetical protein